MKLFRNIGGARGVSNILRRHLPGGDSGIGGVGTQEEGGYSKIQKIEETSFMDGPYLKVSQSHNVVSKMI